MELIIPFYQFLCMFEIFQRKSILIKTVPKIYYAFFRMQIHLCANTNRSTPYVKIKYLAK